MASVRSSYSVATHNRFEQLATDDEGDSAQLRSMGAARSRGTRDTDPEKKVDSANGGVSSAGGGVISKARRAPRAPRQLKSDERGATAAAVTPTNNENVLLQQQQQNTSQQVQQVLSGGEESEKPKRKYKPQQQRSRDAPVNGAIRSNQRPFDRHSGTGRGREMKKRGGGSHNWGNEMILENAPESMAGGGAVVSGGDYNESAAEGSEERKTAAAAAPAVTDYSEYQRTLKAKRDNLLLHDKPQQQLTGQEQRSLNQDEFDNANFQKYEKNQSSGEVNRVDRFRAEHEEVSTRQRVNKISEFTGKMRNANRFSSRGGGRGRGKHFPRSGRRNMDEVERAPRESVEPLIVMDFSDAAAFPTLA